MQWDKRTNVYVYGAGLKGKLLLKALKQMECNVCGYLDRQAGKMADDVILPEEVVQEKRKHCIVVCSVANVFDHVRIAENLFTLGYEYIVYKDFSGKNDLFDMLWDYIENEKGYDIEEIKRILYKSRIKKYGTVNSGKYEKKEYKVVACKKGYIDVEVPVILLHTMSKERYYQVHKRQDWARVPYDKNVYYYLYCGELYQLFEKGGTEKEWKEFIECYKRYFSNADVFSVKDLESNFVRHIEQRYEIYKKMNWLFLNQRSFFEENPILLLWNNEKHIFNVMDGNNRLAFLMVKGVQKVTCRMQKTDYLKWKNEDVYRELCSNQKSDLIEAQAYLLYPSLSGQDNMEYGGYQMVKIQKLMKFLGEKRFLEESKRILLLSEDIVLANCFDKMGIKLHVLAGQRIDSVKYEMLMKLFYMNSTMLVEQVREQDADYDMIYVEIKSELEPDEEQKICELCKKCSNLMILEGKQKLINQLKKKVAGQQYIAQSIFTYWSAGQLQEIQALKKRE